MTGNGEGTKEGVITGDIPAIALSLAELGRTSFTSKFVLLIG